MLQNASSLAIVAVDTEENEPIKNEVCRGRHAMSAGDIVHMRSLS